MAASPSDACDTGRLVLASGLCENHAMQGIFRAARHLALIALIVRAMLPTGWMPDAQAGLTICSLAGIHHDGAPAQDGHSQHDDCPFAAAAQLAPAADLPFLTAPALHAFAATMDRRHAAQIAARFVPGSPRAPPAFA